MAINNNGDDQVDEPINYIITTPKCYDLRTLDRITIIQGLMSPTAGLEGTTAINN
jgi:hypothetical protein